MMPYPNHHSLIARRLGIHNVRATAAACPQRGHADPSAGDPLHSQFRWSHTIPFEPTHETETALNAAPLLF